MSSKSKYKNYLWILITLLVILMDRVTKVLIVNHLPFEQPVPIFPLFSLYFTYNAGAAFSFLSQAGGWQEWLFGGIAIIVSSIIIIWLIRLPRQQFWLKTALALILGGSLGNLYDRVFIHHVVDFLLFYYHSYHFPAFNVADSAITTGAIMLIIDILWKNKAKN